MATRNRFSHKDEINDIAECLYGSKLGNSVEGDNGLTIGVFAYHIGEIMTRPSGEKFTLYYGASGHMRAEIEVKASGTDPVWDQVSINGVSCGNRCGAREVYTAMVTPFLRPNFSRDGVVDQSIAVQHRDAAQAIINATKKERI